MEQRDEDNSKESDANEEEYLKQYYEQLNIRSLDVNQIVERMNLLRFGSRSLEDIRSLSKPKEDVPVTASSSKDPDPRREEPTPADPLNLDNIPAGCVRSEPSSPKRGGMYIRSLVDDAKPSEDPFDKPHWPPARCPTKSLRGNFPVGLGATQRPGQAPRAIVKSNWRNIEGNTVGGTQEPSTSKATVDKQESSGSKGKNIEAKDLRFKSSTRIPYGSKVSQSQSRFEKQDSSGNYKGMEQPEDKKEIIYAKGGGWRSEMKKESSQMPRTQIGLRFPHVTEQWNKICFEGIEQKAAKPIPILGKSINTSQKETENSTKNQGTLPVKLENDSVSKLKQDNTGLPGPSRTRESPQPEKHGYLRETIASKSKENSPVAKKCSPIITPKESKYNRPLRLSEGRQQLLQVYVGKDGTKELAKDDAKELGKDGTKELGKDGSKELGKDGNKELPGYCRETVSSKSKEKAPIPISTKESPTAESKKRSSIDTKRSDSSPTQTAGRSGYTRPLSTHSSKSCDHSLNPEQSKTQGKRYTFLYGKESQKVFANENLALENKSGSNPPKKTFTEQRSSYATGECFEPQFSMHRKESPGKLKKEVAVKSTVKKEEPSRATETKASGSLVKKNKPRSSFMTRSARSDDNKDCEPDFTKYHRKEKKGKGKDLVKSKSSGSLYSKEVQKSSLAPRHSSYTLQPKFERRSTKIEADSTKVEAQKPGLRGMSTFEGPPARQASFQHYRKELFDKLSSSHTKNEDTMTSGQEIQNPVGAEFAGPSCSREYVPAEYSKYVKPPHLRQVVSATEPHTSQSASSHPRAMLHPEFNQRYEPSKPGEKKDIAVSKGKAATSDLAEKKVVEGDAGPSLRPCIPFGLGSARPHQPQPTRTFFKSGYARGSTSYKDEPEKACRPGITHKPDKKPELVKPTAEVVTKKVDGTKKSKDEAGPSKD